DVRERRRAVPHHRRGRVPRAVVEQRLPTSTPAASEIGARRDRARPVTAGTTSQTTRAIHPTTILRSSVVVAVGTALSRLTGFLRVAAIAYALGAGAVAGTYSYANETPNIVYELLLGGVLTATLVRLFVSHIEKHEDEAISAIVTVAMVVLV